MGNANWRQMAKLFSKPTNTEGLEAGVKVEQQAEGKDGIYKLVRASIEASKHDRGLLVEATAEAFLSKDYEKLHNLIREQLHGYLYNDGKGAWIPIGKMVEQRNADRMREKKKEIQKNRHRLKGLSRTIEEEKQFKSTSENKRYCCWKFELRGHVGENILHLCLLNNTPTHNMLAEQLINIYPNLLHDIYHSEEYYGEAPLHMALANEDMPMLKLMLKKAEEINLNLQERCFGNFFSPDDQKSSRRDDPNSETILVDLDTDYKGFTYWGELPLSFAACLNQTEAFKLLVDHHADLFAVDTNGNNVLHMMVIHKNKDMFNLAYRMSKAQNGRNLLECKNRLGFTPLTLAAKLANKDMFDHILELKSITTWNFGEVVCKEYPLSDLDTINMKDGSINNHSALKLVLSEESTDHLNMLDGLLYELLHEKWKSYAKVRFYKRGAGFVFYTILLITAVYLHPAEPSIITNPSLGLYSTNCYLPTFASSTDIARTVFEILVYIGAWVFTGLAASELYSQGYSLFLWTLTNAPTKASFLISCILVIILLPCRLTCALAVEDILISLTVCTCIPYLLFFCRGFKLVGPFIVMIYNMIFGDLIRFLIIYAIFLLGFSQAMFVLFRGTDHEFFASQHGSIMAMFLMMLGEFKDIYNTFDTSRNPSAPKTLFVFYMILVTILLLNMLIAMMGNTFNRIAQTHKEWQRQWAKIVLVMEQSVSKHHRLGKQRRYSQPMGDDGKERGFVTRRRIVIKDEEQRKMKTYVSRFRNAESAAEPSTPSEPLAPSPSTYSTPIP